MYQESYLRYAIQEVHGSHQQNTSEMATLDRQGTVDKEQKSCLGTKDSTYDMSTSARQCTLVMKKLSSSTKDLDVS